MSFYLYFKFSLTKQKSRLQPGQEPAAGGKGGWRVNPCCRLRGSSPLLTLHTKSVLKLNIEWNCFYIRIQFWPACLWLFRQVLTNLDNPCVKDYFRGSLKSKKWERILKFYFESILMSKCLKQCLSFTVLEQKSDIVLERFFLCWNRNLILFLNKSNK